MNNLALVDIFKEAVAELDPERMARLAERFNTQVRVLPRLDQMAVLKPLVEADLLPRAVLYMMEHTGGTFAGWNYDHRRIALQGYNDVVKKGLTEKQDQLDWIAHGVKHMGLVSKDFYDVMAEVRKILKIKA